MKKIFSLIILLISIISNVNALDNTIDLTKKGSINITLKETKEDNLIDGAEVTIYYVADIAIKDNNIIYNKRNELTCQLDFNNLEDIELVKNISKCINDNVIKYIGITNNGQIKFSNLAQGIYLVSQTKRVEGYSNIDSFLISIPKIENNKYIYDINAYPKSDIYKVIDLIIQKKWNTISDDIPKSVSIELYKDDTLIDRVNFGKEDNWMYTFKNMPKSKYTVKEINIPKGFTPSYQVKENIFTITNSDVLANTGRIFYPIIICFSIGLIFIFFGIRIIKKEK